MMKTFNIFRHPDAAVESVKVGFSWPAFFFGGLWMLDKGLWGRAALWFASYAGVKLLADLAHKVQGGDYLSLLLTGSLVALALIAGRKGNRWWEESLLSRGYFQMTTLSAPTPDEAICSYLDRPIAGGMRPQSSYTVQEG